MPMHSDDIYKNKHIYHPIDLSPNFFENFPENTNKP